MRIRYQAPQEYYQRYRGYTTYFPLFLIIGSCVLQFFINISGGVNSAAFSRFYWSQATTRGLFYPGYEVTRWTNYGMCEGVTGKNTEYLPHKAAYPYSPIDNFGYTNYDDLPQAFVTHRKTYYYLSRFSYAFFLIGIVFTVFALMPTFLSVCFIVPGWATYLLTIPVINAFFFVFLGTLLNTIAHAKGVKVFKAAGFDAKIGPILFGFSWASSGMLFLAYIILLRVAEKR